MSEENKNKDDKEFSFIQEQITSKKKGKLKKMLYSVAWTMVLACIFGVAAGVVFCVSEPSISKFLGKQQDKKTVQFPTITSEDVGSNTQDSLSPTPSGTETMEEQSSDDGKNCNDTSEAENEVDPQPTTVVIEQDIKADLTDFTSMYADLRTIASEVNNSIVTVNSINSGLNYFASEYEETMITTGLVVANNEADLLILVSWDKIKETTDIQVTLSDSLQLDARLQDYDSDLNLAVIAVSLEDIPQSYLSNIKTATLGESYSLIVGTPIMALGCPNGYTGSMEIGIITSKNHSVYVTDNKIDLFNTDINYNENSDGVIVNLNGEVMGIITHQLKDDLNTEVNTVIGITKIKKLIESLVNHTDRIYFGIKGADMTNAALNKDEIIKGIYVTEVETDSPALEGGLQSGDIITAMNGTPIISVNSFNSLLSVCEPKASVKITIQRSTKNTYKKMDFNVILAKKSH